MKAIWCRLAAALLLAATASAADAVVIELAPSAQNVTLSEMASVDLRISGLGDGAAPSLGGFDLDVTYDAAILALTDVTFGSLLGDEAVLEAITDVVPGTGRVNVFELSFLFDFELDALQPDVFTLATLTFDTLSVGLAQLAFENVILSNLEGEPLPLDAAGSGTIAVQAPAVPVPEPSAWWLTTGALLVMLYHRQRRGRSDWM